jgi:hypothetical protein
MIRDERAKNKENQDTELVKVQKQFDETVLSLRNQLKEKEKEMTHFKVTFILILILTIFNSLC